MKGKKTMLKSKVSKWFKGIKLSHAEVFLLRRALEDYQNRELESEKKQLLEKIKALEKRYENLTISRKTKRVS